jgi:hypothetical protein
MAPKRGANTDTMSKKVAGQARKAETAANKKAVKAQEVEAVETKKWEEGSRDSSKKEAAAAKAAELARKKAERAALEEEEMASLKSAKVNNAKSAAKKGSAAPKSRGLDLAQLDAPETSKKGTALNATGIDSALDALSLTSGTIATDIERHPERRFKAAYNIFETRRLEEMKDDKTLRRNQKIEQIRKEFEKSPENPFNKLTATFNTTREEMSALRTTEADKVETLLGN